MGSNPAGQDNDLTRRMFVRKLGLGAAVAGGLAAFVGTDRARAGTITDSTATLKPMPAALALSLPSTPIPDYNGCPGYENPVYWSLAYRHCNGGKACPNGGCCYQEILGDCVFYQCLDMCSPSSFETCSSETCT